MKQSIRLLLSIVGCELVGLLSGLATASSVRTWYAGLVKPFFSPPNWVFGPVWTLLYAMMGVTLFLLWGKKKARGARQAFFIQLALNFVWSLLFFGLRSPLLALIEIIILWGMIALTIRRSLSVSKLAGYLLLPYLAWVSFATLLNASIVYLNRL